MMLIRALAIFIILFSSTALASPTFYYDYGTTPFTDAIKGHTEEVETRSTLRELELQQMKKKLEQQKKAAAKKLDKERASRIDITSKACDKLDLNNLSYKDRLTCQTIRNHQRYGDKVPNSMIDLPDSQ